MSKAVPYALRLPASVMRLAKETAEREGISLNQFIASAVRGEAVGDAGGRFLPAAGGRRRPRGIRRPARPDRAVPAARGR